MSGHSEDVRTIEAAKKQLIESSFGKEKAPKVQEINTQLAKAVFEARKAQVEAQKAIFEQRKELINGIDKVCCPLLHSLSTKTRPVFGATRNVHE